MSCADSFTRCAAFIDLSAIKKNAARLKSFITPGTGIIAVVKADAYGHGVLPVSKALIEAGVRALGVATAEEGAFLRESGVSAPIIVFGHCLSGDMDLALENRLTLTVADAEQARFAAGAARRLGIPAQAHFKVDTGMTRLGLPAEAAFEELIKIREVGGLAITAICTHLADSDAPGGEYARSQTARFFSLLKKLEDVGISLPWHMSNSGAALRYREYDGAFVRAGVALYGVSHPRGFGFLPALSLKARVAFVKDVPAGTPVGYGGTHVTAKPSTIAVIPIGYADGYSRALSNKADVLIGGRRAPVVGCVCMDQMMADVTGVPAAPGDLATLIGKDGTGEITADELAEKAGMIPYEIVTGLSPRVKRFYDDARP